MTGEPFTIRRAQAGDADRLAALNEAALREVDAYAESVADEDFSALERTYFDRGGTFLVGELEGKVIAMGALAPVDAESRFVLRGLDPGDGAAATVTRMRVDPAHQRSGYGSRLLVALEDRARTLGFEVLVLDTTARQVGAQRLYSSFGYERVDRFDWRDYEMLLFKKRLGTRRTE